MACQAGLVMTEVGGLNDYLIPGKTGLVSPIANPESLADNIISLIENPQLLKEISLAGYQKAQEFSYQIQAGKMEAIFQEIIKEGFSTEAFCPLIKPANPFTPAKSLFASLGPVQGYR